MNRLATRLRDSNLRRLQQYVKWTVYALLIVNFGFYIWEDSYRALHTLDTDSTLFKWTSEFATSIDIAAWFILLLMFELETNLLDDTQWRRWVAVTVRGLRLICYVMLAHTVVAYSDTVLKYSATRPLAMSESLCEVAHDRLAFVYNLEYTAIDTDNCNRLSSGNDFYWLGDDPLVTSAMGLQIARRLAWADVVEAVVWLVIVLSMELIVRRQHRGITKSPLISGLKLAKGASYGILFVLAVYWAVLGHWLYTWDTFLWIGGFAAIELNVSKWREEILQDSQAASNDRHTLPGV